MDYQIRSAAVIIPAYNAGSSIEELIDRLYHSLPEAKIIVVDDGSIDRTGECAESKGAYVLRHQKNKGKGAALQTGFDFIKSIADIKFVVTIDADLQHRPEDILDFFFVQKQTDAEVVIGWRQRVGTSMPVHRILSNTITSAMVGFRTGVKIKDSQCGFRLIKRTVLERVRLDASGYEAETEFLIKTVKQGFRIKFVPIRTIYGGEKSHMKNWSTIVNFVKLIFRKYK
jgi:glycosyltransferase involved in cell wall biosynthesis